MDAEDARERLMELDGIGEGRAETILGAFDRNPRRGPRGQRRGRGAPAFAASSPRSLRVTATDTAPIDEPVTTDTRRLIRLPGRFTADLDSSSRRSIATIWTPSIRSGTPFPTGSSAARSGSRPMSIGR